MMAKLYWRVKRNGKWTWTPAEVRVVPTAPPQYVCVLQRKGEEE